MKSLSFVLKAGAVGVLTALVLVFFILDDNEQSIQNQAALETLNQGNLPGAVHSGRLSGPFSYADAVSQASPSVVNIYTTKTVQTEGGGLGSPLLERFFGIPRRPQNRRQSGLGSGVIFSEQGHIVTNYHVVNAADDIRVILYDGRDFAAEVIGADPETDLAILKIPAGMLVRINLGQSDSLRVGDVVLAIGNPFGVGQTVTMGIISATGRDRVGLNTFENFIQTDAAINPGNSGGALVNAVGELIGINTAIFSRDGGSQGIGFAIPVDMVRKVLTQIISHGEVIRGWLGVEAHDIPAANRPPLDVKGVIIAGVFREGPADKAGLRRGDVITQINDEVISDTHKLLEVISDSPPGTKLEVSVWRDNEYQQIGVVLAQRPQTRQ